MDCVRFIKKYKIVIGVVVIISIGIVFSVISLNNKPPTYKDCTDNQTAFTYDSNTFIKIPLDKYNSGKK